MAEHSRHLCENCRNEQYESFAHGCTHELMALNQAWIENYKIAEWQRWDYSLEHCTLTFSQAGQPKVVCEIRVAGSVQGDSWEWSWGNGNLPDSCKARVDEVRAFGEEKQWDKLTSLFLNNDEYLGWELASVAAHILGGRAIYRCPDKLTPEYFVYLIVLSSQFVN